MNQRIVDEDLVAVTALPLPFQHLAKRRVFVTGAAGFVPAALIETLLHLNRSAGLRVTVIGLVRDRARALRRFARYAGHRDFRLIVGDAARPQLPSQIDWIVHAASQASPSYYCRDPVGTLAPNSLGTPAVLEAARKNRAAVLFLSSSEIYGVPRRAPLREQDFGPLDPLDPRSCYAESKRMGETACAAWHRQHGVEAKIARLFHTYGPGMKLNDGRVFSDFVGDAVAGRDIVIHGDGRAVRSYSYVFDSVAGLLTVMLKGDSARAYNIGNDQAAASVSRLARIVAASKQGVRLRVVRKAPRHARAYVPSAALRVTPDVSRLRDLGWTPRYDLCAGFKRTLEYYL